MDDALHWFRAGVRAPGDAAFDEGPSRAVEDPDAALVAEARRDPSRFLALYDRHFARVHRYVRLRVGESAAAEDVTSDVFMTALSKIGEFRGDGAFGAWLFRIAQNAVRGAHRRRPPARLDDEALAVRDEGPSPEDEVVSRERAAELRELLAGLRSDQQDLLALRYGVGLPYSEIGQVLGMSAGAARVAVHRILEDLRERYSYD